MLFLIFLILTSHK
uniref:Uncharacterized protein n=1 Tax=Rhizophora mucronata TaxID=61149 RepID=A0A2P2NGS2_RHIMU